MENSRKVNVPAPGPEEPAASCTGIWSTAHEHWSSAEWIRSTIETFKDLEWQLDMRITPKNSKGVLRRMRPWKAPGLAAVQMHWVKRFSALHPRISQQLVEVHGTGTAAKWMTTGRKDPVPKDPVKGNVPSIFPHHPYPSPASLSCGSC